MHAVKTLGRIGPAAKDAVPALSGLLKKSKVPLDPNSAAIIAKAAAALGAKSNDTFDLAVPAAIAIDLVEPGNGAARAVMNSMLTDTKGEADYRIDIAEHLLSTAQNPDAIGALVQALRDSNELLRHRAAMILAEFGHDEGVPVLARSLKFDNENVQRETATALAKLGPAARAALPALKEVAVGKSYLSGAAGEAIAKIEGR